MLGNHREGSTSDNPFAPMQRFSLQMYTKQETASDKCYFRVSMNLPNGDWVRIADDFSVTGKLKSVNSFVDQMGGKDMQKCSISLFDEKARFIDLVYSKEGVPLDVQGKAITEERVSAAKQTKTYGDIVYDTRLTDEVVGQSVKLTSSFTYKMKELLNKLSSALKASDSPLVKFVFLKANKRATDGSYTNEPLTDKKGGYVIYNMNVVSFKDENDEKGVWMKPRFGDTSLLTIAREDETVNAEYVTAEAQCKDLQTGKPLEKFFIKLIAEDLQPQVEKVFAKELTSLGYQLVATGEIDEKTGKEKMKYQAIGSAEPVDTPVGGTQNNAASNDEPKPDKPQEDLPF